MNRTGNLTGAQHWLVADGVKSSMTIPAYTTGSFSQGRTEFPNGYEGSCPFPARLDHSHPLNVRTIGETGFTSGDNIDSSIRPCGHSSYLGTSNYYARMDHRHAIKDNGNAKSILACTTPYAPTGGSSGVVTIRITGTSKISSVKFTNSTNEKYALWSRGSTKNTAESVANNTTCGLKLWVVSEIRKPDITNTKQGYAYLYMRECTFDQNGALMNVGEEKFGCEVVLPTI